MQVEKAQLPYDYQAFWDRLSDADKQLNIGGVQVKLEEIACGLDACEKVIKTMRLLSGDLCIQFIEERTRKTPDIVPETLNRLDVVIANTAEELTQLRKLFKHYHRLLVVLRAKETVDRINRGN